MNRWPGDKAASDLQASQRSSRAARRTLNNLDLNLVLSDEEPFEDANQSFSSNLNLDGDTSIPESADASSSSSTPSVMALFEDINAEDHEKAWEKEIKIKFDQDVRYWFNSVEAQMKKYGINKQWSKKDAIVPLLPPEIVEECKPILRLTEAEAGNNIYKVLKTEILSLYGPRDEDAFKKAMACRLTGKPSALGKKLIHIWCPGAKPFDGCHCARVVYGFWESQLTPEIKTKLAGQKFTKDTYQDMFKQADEVWIANGGTTTLAPTVVAATSVPPSSSNAAAAAQHQSEVPQVSATTRGGRGGRGRGRGGRGNRGGGGRGSYNGNQNQNNNTRQNQQQNQTTQQTGQKPHQRGPKAAPDVPADACARHWKEGRNATYCSDPLVCSWAHIIVPRK